MDFVIFLLTFIILITALFFWLEKKTLISMIVLMGLCFLIGGDLVANGLLVPNGYTLTTVGATTTVTQTTASFTSANNGWILGSGWILIFFGFYYLIKVLLFAIGELTKSSSKVEGIIGKTFGEGKLRT